MPLLSTFGAASARGIGLYGRPPLSLSVSASIGTSPVSLGVPLQLRTVFAASLFSANAGTIRITVRASSSGATVNGAHIGPKAGSGDAWDTSSMTRITFDGGNNSSGSISASSTKTSDIIVYNLDEAVDQVIALSVSAGDLGFHSGATSGMSQYYKTATADETATPNVSGYSQDASNAPWGITLLEY